MDDGPHDGFIFGPGNGYGNSSAQSNTIVDYRLLGCGVGMSKEWC